MTCLMPVFIFGAVVTLSQLIFYASVGLIYQTRKTNMVGVKTAKMSFAEGPMESGRPQTIN